MEEVVQVAFQEETVKKPPEISREIKDKILEEVNLVISAFSNFVTLHLDCEEQGPLLNILSIKSDPFYVDQSVLHANITVLDTSQLLFSYLTPNREIYGDKIVINDVATELPSLLDKLSQTNLISCTGFNWQDPRLGTLFQRIRKSDIDWSLIEKFNGQVVYRSRTCKYVCPELSANTEHPFFTSQCFDCQNYLRELDKKYMGGKILETISEEASSQDVAVNVTDEIDTIVAAEGIDSDSKPKRGRPKGSKNRIYVRSSEIGECKLEENDENSDPSMAVDVIDGDRILVNSDDPDFIYGTEDITLEEESPAESKINLHKGFRKRITTKRQKALLETKRKRGRPPIKVGPIDCSDCEKIFDTVKDWRKHILEHKNSFACSFGDCVKRFKCQKDLEVHLRKHRGEKPYVCSECDKAYAIRQDLRLHIRTQHTGKVEFVKGAAFVILVKLFRCTPIQV